MFIHHNPLQSSLRRFAWVALIACLMAAVAGCRTSPIKEVTGTSIPPGLTQEKVEKAIISAGAGLGWAMKIERPGLIFGSLTVRDHLAQVQIPYTTKTYSINYKNSVNLKYDATTHTIHSNYNAWIDNLNHAILANLAMM
jgi:hypothetical protein